MILVDEGNRKRGVIDEIISNNRKRLRKNLCAFRKIKMIVINCQATTPTLASYFFLPPALLLPDFPGAVVVVGGVVLTTLFSAPFVVAEPPGAT